jgi:chromosome segregation ATPase
LPKSAQKRKACFRAFCYAFISFFHNSKGKMAADNAADASAELGWEALVALKRKLSSDLKKITDEVNDIDEIKSRKISAEIRDLKQTKETILEKIRDMTGKIEQKNSELLDVSAKMSQSKDFLSILENRLPKENESELLFQIQTYQAQVDAKDFKTTHEREEIVSKIKEMAMKVEALKAARMVRNQFESMQQISASLSAAVRDYNATLHSIKAEALAVNDQLDKLYEAKRQLQSERERLVSRYDETMREFETVNSKLDAMSDMRKKQRIEYGYNLPNDALFKVKENAKKKLEAGAKLTFEELKLLYGDKDSQ